MGAKSAVRSLYDPRAGLYDDKGIAYIDEDTGKFKWGNWFNSQKPSTPHYNQDAAQAEQYRINQTSANQLYADVNSPLGGYYTTVDPTTGQITVNKQLSENSQNALNQQQNILSAYNSDIYNYGDDAANAYYNAQMAYLQPQMQRQTMRSETALTNRGIPIGGAAWNEYMGDVRDAQNQQLSGLGSAALTAGQGYETNMLGQANMLGSQVIDPTMISGQAGAGLENTYDQQFGSQVAQYKTDMAGSNIHQQVLGAGGTIVGGALGGYFTGWNPYGIMGGAALGGAAGTAIGTGMDNG